MIWNDQTILTFPHFFSLPDSLFWKVPFSKSNLKVKYPCEFWNVWYWKLKITFRSFKWGITHFCTLAMNRAGACFPNYVWKKSSFFARHCKCVRFKIHHFVPTEIWISCYFPPNISIKFKFFLAFSELKSSDIRK